MRDNRKNVKVTGYVKDDLDTVKKDLLMKTESQAIAYMIIAYHKHVKNKITFKEHQEIMKEVSLMNGPSILGK